MARSKKRIEEGNGETRRETEKGNVSGKETGGGSVRGESPQSSVSTAGPVVTGASVGASLGVVSPRASTFLTTS